MGVERVDYYSDDEYEQALSQECNSQPQYPDVVPCYKCGCQMYQDSEYPKDNICIDCEKE